MCLGLVPPLGLPKARVTNTGRTSNRHYHHHYYLDSVTLLLSLSSSLSGQCNHLSVHLLDWQTNGETSRLIIIITNIFIIHINITSYNIKPFNLLNLRCMWTSTSRSWTFSTSMTKSFRSRCPCQFYQDILFQYNIHVNFTKIFSFYWSNYPVF